MSGKSFGDADSAGENGKGKICAFEADVDIGKFFLSRTAAGTIDAADVTDTVDAVFRRGDLQRRSVSGAGDPDRRAPFDSVQILSYSLIVPVEDAQAVIQKFQNDGAYGILYDVFRGPVFSCRIVFTLPVFLSFS